KEEPMGGPSGKKAPSNPSEFSGTFVENRRLRQEVEKLRKAQKETQAVLAKMQAQIDQLQTQRLIDQALAAAKAAQEANERFWKDLEDRAGQRARDWVDGQMWETFFSGIILQGAITSAFAQYNGIMGVEPEKSLGAGILFSIVTLALPELG